MESGSDRCMGTDGYDPKNLYFYEIVQLVNIGGARKHDVSKIITNYLACFPCLKI